MATAFIIIVPLKADLSCRSSKLTADMRATRVRDTAMQSCMMLAIPIQSFGTAVQFTSLDTLRPRTLHANCTKSDVQVPFSSLENNPYQRSEMFMVSFKS
uniref:Uncharacterized protein n=1 Tax=Oryza meridionalis TaxID=40149 RepID=A0A0E0CZA7_9ORYZ